MQFMTYVAVLEFASNLHYGLVYSGQTEALQSQLWVPSHFYKYMYLRNSRVWRRTNPHQKSSWPDCTVSLYAHIIFTSFACLISQNAHGKCRYIISMNYFLSIALNLADHINVDRPNDNHFEFQFFHYHPQDVTNVTKLRNSENSMNTWHFRNETPKC